MAVRFYLMPLNGAGTLDDPRVPKYAALVSGQWSSMDFGAEPICIFSCDVSDAEHTSLTAGHSDVVALPLNLDANVSAGALSAVTAALEAINVPAQWVNTSLTYRQVARIVVGYCQFLQRLHFVHGAARVFGGTVTMATTFGSLSATLQADLIATALSFDFDTTGLTADTTVRQILTSLADQWGDRPALFGGVAL